MQPQARGASPAFGNITVVQNDSDNNSTSVTATLSYTQAALGNDGTTSLGSFNLRSGSNRGDVLLRFSSSAANDRAQGIMISNVAQLARDNSAFGDPAGSYFATSATAHDGNGYFISVQAVTSAGPEFNANLAAAWFPYADGWIGGHAVNSVNGGLLTSLVGSPGLTLSTTAAGPNTLYDPGATGVYELNLSGINSQTDGILLVSGGKNEDNYALSTANADGTWTITVRDNFSGSGNEADGLAFVYVPKTAAVAGSAPGVHAMGRLNGNLTRDVSAGTYAMVRTATGQYRLYAPGIDPAQATLLISPEFAGIAGDNVLFYEPTAKGWNIEARDLTPLTLQDNTSTEDTLSFALMASANTAAVWDGGGVNTTWGAVGNWQGDATPLAGRDVILSAGTGNVQIDSPQSAGMVFIGRDAGFTLSGSTLSLSTGLIVNAQPASSQTYIVSAPLEMTDDAFIISQSVGGSAVTVRLDVASGNAVTAANKNLTLAGGSAIEIRDPIDLGGGLLIKEGGGQVTLLAANSVGGTQIVTGPNSETSGAIRINNPAAYGALGSEAIVLKNSGTMTALFFDSGAGNGTLANSIVLQTGNGASGARFLVDNSASFNATISGLITGGEATSDFIVSSDAANGQGCLHLTNTANDFVAAHVTIGRGGLVIYGDGSLGAATNPLYLNSANTNGSTGNGLQFGADNITVAATRGVEIASDSVINTGAFQATIAGTVTGTGGLMKAGTGTLVLTGTSDTYQGATSVKEGTLSLQAGSGHALGTGTVTVFSGATLAGSGAVGGAAVIQSGGTLSPGSSPGTLAFEAGLDLQDGSTVALELAGASSYDRVNVSGGTLQVGSSAALQVTLQYTPQAGDSFDLLDWTSLSGDTTLHDNLALPDLASLGLQWDFSQFDSLGLLSIQTVPEPSRVVLLMLGLAGAFLRRRR